MKNTILIAAAIMMATPAFASKARVNALSGAAHIVDVQTAFEKPHEFNEVGELVTFEWGGTGTATPHAEGGFVRKHNENVWGLYLGRQSADVNEAVADVNAATGAATLLNEQNAFNLIYGGKMGALSYGVTFKYSNSKDDTVAQTATTGKQKADVMGVAFGVTDGVWDASAVVGLSGKTSAEVAGGDLKIENKGNFKVHGGMYFDTMYAFGSFKQTSAEATLAPVGAANQENETQSIEVGVINTTKVEGADFFYGVSYAMDTEKEKVGNTKTETSTLPVIIGVEAEATSWLSLRASLTQNVLLGETKTGNAKATIADNTTVAAGAGLKFGKLSLDGVLSTAGGQLLDNHGTDGLMGEASLTYTF